MQRCCNVIKSHTILGVQWLLRILHLIVYKVWNVSAWPYQPWGCLHIIIIAILELYKIGLFTRFDYVDLVLTFPFPLVAAWGVQSPRPASLRLRLQQTWSHSGEAGKSFSCPSHSSVSREPFEFTCKQTCNRHGSNYRLGSAVVMKVFFARCH